MGAQRSKGQVQKKTEFKIILMDNHSLPEAFSVVIGQYQQPMSKDVAIKRTTCKKEYLKDICPRPAHRFLSLLFARHDVNPQACPILIYTKKKIKQ